MFVNSYARREVFFVVVFVWVEQCKVMEGAAVPKGVGFPRGLPLLDWRFFAGYRAVDSDVTQVLREVLCWRGSNIGLAKTIPTIDAVEVDHGDLVWLGECCIRLARLVGVLEVPRGCSAAQTENKLFHLLWRAARDKDGITIAEICRGYILARRNLRDAQRVLENANRYSCLR